jgi:hypothetical protein
LNVITKNGWSPLRWAVRRRRLPVIRYLLDRSPSTLHSDIERADLIATARTTGAALWLEDSMLHFSSFPCCPNDDGFILMV